MILRFFDFENEIQDDTDFAIFGIPWDYLTSIELPNSAIAPEKIREVTNDIALTTELGYKITDFKAADLGDIEIVKTNIDKNIKNITEFIKKIYKKNKNIIPIMLGGDHFCSYPVIKAINEFIREEKKFGVLIFDSHLDFYEEWDKGVYSHATISHRIYDLDNFNEKNIFIVGVRDIDIPELENASKKKLSYLKAYKIYNGINEYTTSIIQFFKDNNIKSLYISIDIDALDPSIAPGTGFAIPGGFSYREFWLILKRIVEEFDIIGFDLVEVAPNLDLPNKITCNLAAKIIIELMSFIKFPNKR
ncbi:MAG: agmatinase [Promethearchaeota archaeon]